MTNEEAVNLIRGYASGIHPENEYRKALDLAIKNLENKGHNENLAKFGQDVLEFWRNYDPTDPNTKVPFFSATCIIVEKHGFGLE